MKKMICILFLLLLFLSIRVLVPKGAMARLGEAGFCRLLQWEGARAVFGLNEEEAAEVFLQYGGEHLL